MAMLVITRGYVFHFPSIIPSLSHYHPYKTILNHVNPLCLMGFNVTFHKTILICYHYYYDGIVLVNSTTSPWSHIDPGHEGKPRLFSGAAGAAEDAAWR